MSSSSSEDEVIASFLYLKKIRRRRKHLVHPYNLFNVKHSSAVVTRELSQHPSKFQEVHRITPESFKFLCQLISSHLEKQDTHSRQAISPEEKLLITLR